MNTNDLRARYLELKSKAASVYQNAQAENRELTDGEKSEVRQYTEQMDALDLEQRNVPSMPTASRALVFAEAVKEAIDTNSSIKVRGTDVPTLKADVAGDCPLTIGEIIEPLEKGNIMGLVGCHIQSGMYGAWKYPVVANIEAAIAGENAEINDTKLAITAVEPTPRRVSLSLQVSKTAVNSTNYELKDIVLKQVVAGMDRLLNKWMFGASAISSGVNGLFVNPGTSKTAASQTVFTYAEILAMKGAVDAQGVKPDNTAAYVMTNATKAALEATPRNSGGDHMVIENGMINGVPVYVTEYAAANAIYFGYFSYALVGQFGNTEIVVDPFTKATSNAVRFVLNTDWDIKAARAEAFGKLVLAS